MIGILIPLILIVVSSYIIWKSTDSFETAANYLGRHMSKGVKGATINAIASSMPEFLTTMFFLFYIKDQGVFEDSFSGGLGVIAGSAVFNILIIPAAMIFLGAVSVKNAKIPLDKEAIKRDSLFLIAANVVLVLIIRKTTLDIIDGLILVLTYLFYIFLLRKGFRKSGRTDRTESEILFPKEKVDYRDFVKINLTKIILNGKILNRQTTWFTLLISTIVMSAGTLLLVQATEMLGHDTYTFFEREVKGLGIPIIFLSVLFASAATSIPDTMISVRDSRKGKHTDSISNALGSNIFDISFAIGLPLLLYTAIHGPIEMSYEVRKWSLSIWLILGVINLLVIPVFIYSKTLGKGKGLFLLILYILFILFIIEENSRSGISDFVDKILL